MKQIVEVIDLRKWKRLCALALTVCMSLPSSLTAWAVGGGSGVSTAGTSTGNSNGGTASHNFGVGYIMYLATYGDFVEFSSLPNELITFEDIQNIRFSRLPEVTRHDKIMNGWLYGNFALTNPANVLLADASGVYTKFPRVLGLDGAGSPLKGARVGTDTWDAVDFGVLGAGFGNAAAIDNGAVVADAFMRTFGDAGGKWNDLLSAMSNSKTEADRIIVNKKGGASGSGRGPDSGSDEGYEVETNAAAITPEESAVAWLSISEVQEQFKHYIDWWKLVFDSLNGGSYYSEYDMVKVEEAFNTVTTAATKYVESSGPGGAEEVKNTREFQDFAYGYASALLKYPAVGLNTICMRQLTGEASTRAMTWEGALGGARTWGAETGKVYLDEYNKLEFPHKANRGQQNMRAAGCIFTNTFFQTNKQKNINDVLPESQGLDINAGYVFYGFYGMLPLISSTTITTTTPPPDDPPPPPPTTVPPTDDLGTYYLMDYELNHVFDSMAEHYADSTSHDHARLNTGISTTDPSDYSDCGHGNNDYDTTTYDEVTYHEDEGSGKSVDMDNAGPTKLFLHNNGVKGNTWWTRDEVKAGPSISSSSVGDYVIDYGFNLLRRHFDDAKAYSKIIAQDVSKEYLEQTLGMYEAIMVNDTVKKITTLRDSTAIVGDTAGIRDDLGWYANFTKTGSSIKYKTYANSHTYYCGSDDCSGHTCNYNSSMADGNIQAFSVHGGTAHEYSVGLVSIAHKYQTAPMPTGYARPQDIVPFDYRPTTNGDGSDDDNQYRGSNTIDPGTEVTYVPEVPMIADEVPGPELEHHPKKVITVGEESRKSKLILMTLYRVTGASTPVKGVVYSDTAVGGDAGLSSQTNSRLLALTAGGDFTVKADTNMQVNLYGYALDLIEPGDAGYDTVTLGNDVKAGWGNSGSRNKLMETYQTWAAAMLNPKNYQADFEMTIGSKEYNSFSATVGSFSSKASQSTETGQYNIHVKHGQIQEDAGYNAFISQLASDYGCSESEAKTLFANSDMASAIIKAIEHDNSSANKSKPAKYALAPGEIGTFNEPDLSSMLGNSSHWYDEEVRVFVIRRFMTPAAKVTNIIAQDKMDIGTSMEALGSDRRGSFKLNVWFRNSCYTRAVQEYVPNTSGDNKSAAISAGDLIIAGVDVTGADFNITNATTATGKH